ncbi:MAG: acyl carrier protein [Alphaproteobacteria bacterium]|nr:acyl carrier protein [Alphaproteobacteria bacterium]
MKSIRQEVLKIVAEQAVLDVSDIDLAASMESLGIDSLGLVEVIFAIEEQFDISVPFDSGQPANGAFDLSSIETIISGVQHLIEQKALLVDG